MSTTCVRYLLNTAEGTPQKPTGSYLWSPRQTPFSCPSASPAAPSHQICHKTQKRWISATYSSHPSKMRCWVANLGRLHPCGCHLQPWYLESLLPYLSQAISSFMYEQFRPEYSGRVVSSYTHLPENRLHNDEWLLPGTALLSSIQFPLLAVDMTTTTTTTAETAKKAMMGLP